MSNKKEESTIEEVKKGFNTLFPKVIKSINLEKEEDEETFLFDIEFDSSLDSFNVPEGVVITYLSFKENIIEGFLDSVSFLEYVEEEA